jgi:hypothetical protein
MIRMESSRLQNPAAEPLPACSLLERRQRMMLPISRRNCHSNKVHKLATRLSNSMSIRENVRVINATSVPSGAMESSGSDTDTDSEEWVAVQGTKHAFTDVITTSSACHRPHEDLFFFISYLIFRSGTGELIEKSKVQKQQVFATLDLGLTPPCTGQQLGI